MRIYLVRHGQSNYNVLGLLNEIPTQKVFLTELGIKQAQEAHQKLKMVHFDKVFVSPLFRTWQTAEIIVPNQIQIIDERLNDVVSGCEGKSLNYFHSLLKNKLTDKLPGGESFQDVKKRVKVFLDELLSLKLNTVLIVSHFDTIRAMLVYFNGLSDEEAFQTKVNNCQIIEIENK